MGKMLSVQKVYEGIQFNQLICVWLHHWWHSYTRFSSFSELIIIRIMIFFHTQEEGQNVLFFLLSLNYLFKTSLPQ